jgi:hypothetical protein
VDQAYVVALLVHGIEQEIELTTGQPKDGIDPVNPQ